MEADGCTEVTDESCVELASLSAGEAVPIWIESRHGQL